ncbi:ABC transporter permease [Hyphomonas sp. FCG-A18]|uniref:MlaE family ABC transporter permease n=1 Tax=Hyphomonas sp. FCG-A18 TaxID=3080019 RepID=UPI002B2AD0F8|nr:ABC transporter permease [Hyphomonas sp. FCG-A18]
MQEPQFDLFERDGRVQLVLRGAWTVSQIGSLDEALRAASNGLDSGNRPLIDCEQIAELDTAGAYLIDRTIREITAETPDIKGGEDAQALLIQARTVATRIEEAPKITEPGHGFIDLLERTGRGALHLWEELVESLSFFGAMLVSVAGVVLRPHKMRWTALVAVMEESGLDAVPIVAFLSFFVGMVVAFIGATTLSDFGATIFVVELVGFGLLRELAGVLAAIIIAGRTNSAFTAQIGAMKMRQEVDAMTTLGLEPMDVLVAPRVLAMVLMVPVLTFVAMVAGIAGGMTVSWMALDITPTVFLNRMQDYVPATQFWIGMSKAPVFGLVIALIGCRQGLQVGGSVQSLGQHTTKSVVQALFAIIVIDALFALFYMELGL